MSICGGLIDSGQWRLFSGRMWICASVCECLVIWCDKTTVHEIIIDYNSSNIFYMLVFVQFTGYDSRYFKQY
jgi:hypothetical protein